MAEPVEVPLVAEPVEVPLPEGQQVVLLAKAVPAQVRREEPVERAQREQVRQGLRVMAVQAVQRRRREVVVVTADMEGMAAAAPV